MLSLLSKKYSSNNINLFRDDRLSVFTNISGQQAQKHKQIIQKFFKDKGFQIIIKCNLKIVDYLDIILNLNVDTYCAFHKRNEEASYIHVEYDHSPHIIKKILKLKKDYPTYLQQTKNPNPKVT